MRSLSLRAVALLAAAPLFTACLDAGPGGSGTAQPLPDATDTSTSAPDADAGKDVAEPDAATSDAAGDAPTPACHAIGEGCDDGGACCQGFCSSTLQVYAPGVCTAPQPDGAFCTEGAQCASGACTDSICGAAPVCTPTGAECWDDDACCTGICTFDPNQNDVGACVVSSPQCQALGAACVLGAECCSGACSGQGGATGACVEAGPSCDDQPAECWSSTECCAGTFCSYTGFDYTPGQCMPRLPDGAWCASAQWCASGHCVDAQCVPAQCGAAGDDCYWGGDCCTGLCSNSGQAYVPGKCFEPLSEGATCEADAWCATGHCADGLCAKPAQPATFQRVWDEVLVPKGCTSGYCHGAPGGGLDLSSEDMAYWSLTGPPAGTPACGAFLRVVPGHPDHSVLWLRVRPMALEPSGEACLPKMPHGSQGLDGATAALVEDWILQGALP